MCYPLCVLASLLLLVCCSGVEAGNAPSPSPPSQNAAESLSKSGGRIQLKWIVTDSEFADGARYQTTSISPSIYDTKLSVNCSGRVAEDGAMRCLPLGSAYVQTGAFVDDKCSTKLVLSMCQAESERFVVSQAPSNACGPQKFEVYTLEPAKKLEKIYMKFGAMCQENTNPYIANYLTYAISGKMDPSEFV